MQIEYSASMATSTSAYVILCRGTYLLLSTGLSGIFIPNFGLIYTAKTIWLSLLSGYPSCRQTA